MFAPSTCIRRSQALFMHEQPLAASALNQTIHPQCRDASITSRDAAQRRCASEGASEKTRPHRIGRKGGVTSWQYKQGDADSASGLYDIEAVPR